ncbi:hypothetical protein [uncultured Parabacteroides sp.]|uniref:hypothetical protein n=1 Tax=uncultured Parabacteroides sp. TaxID=512312 RepID=UPI0025F91608|nr:hypothetical protein [uncultured Parabacteroides sp.]
MKTNNIIWVDSSILIEQINEMIELAKKSQIEAMEKDDSYRFCLENGFQYGYERILRLIDGLIKQPKL